MDIKYYLRLIKRIIKDGIEIERRKIQMHQKYTQEYPRVIQLPITYLCNFDCVMCGMHHMVHKRDFSAKELGVVLTDKLFANVEAIGVNGGEPFLKGDIIECFTVMIEKIPKLKELNIISNGFFTDKILYTLKILKSMCRGKNISIKLSLSVDGVGDMQDFHRGHTNAYKNVCNTINAIMTNKSEYVDYINIICTITRHNIYRINEIDVWARGKGVDVAYNIATKNVRIENEDRESEFSIFYDDESRMLAQEFFYSKYLETGSERYFAIYLFLKTKKRYDICPCMFNEWITLTPDCQIGFCATYSKNLGSGLEKSSYEIVKDNLLYLEFIKNNYCAQCSHYIYGLNTKGLKLMQEDRKKNIFMR